MSLRKVPEEELVLGVTRVRHVEFGMEGIFVGRLEPPWWETVQVLFDGHAASQAVHPDDVEVIR